MSLLTEMKAFWDWCCGGKRQRDKKECAKREHEELDAHLEKVRQSFHEVKEARMEGRMKTAIAGIASNDLRRVVDDTVRRLQEAHEREGR